MIWLMLVISAQFTLMTLSYLTNNITNLQKSNSIW